MRRRELADEAARMRLFPGIAFRGPAPRRAWLIGTGLDVWELCAILVDHHDDDRVVEAYAAVTPAVIRLARAYAERFPREIDDLIARGRRTPDELRHAYPFVQVIDG